MAGAPSLLWQMLATVLSLTDDLSSSLVVVYFWVFSSVAWVFILVWRVIGRLLFSSGCRMLGRRSCFMVWRMLCRYGRPGWWFLCHWLGGCFAAATLLTRWMLCHLFVATTLGSLGEVGCLGGIFSQMDGRCWCWSLFFSEGLIRLIVWWRMMFSFLSCFCYEFMLFLFLLWSFL